MLESRGLSPPQLEQHLRSNLTFGPSAATTSRRPDAQQQSASSPFLSTLRPHHSPPAVLFRQIDPPAASDTSPDPPAFGPTAGTMPPDNYRPDALVHLRAVSRAERALPEGPGSEEEEARQQRQRQQEAEQTVQRISIRSRKRAPTPRVASISSEEDAPPVAKRAKRGNLKNSPSTHRATSKKSIPSRRGKGKLKKEQDDEVEDAKPAAVDQVTASCCICMEEPKPLDLAKINGCAHLFCFECIEKWSERENSCPLCKTRFAKIDRVNKMKRQKGCKNTKKVKNRDQRSEIAPGTALEGLLASFASSANFNPNLARFLAGMNPPGGRPFVMPASSAARSSAARRNSAVRRRVRAGQAQVLQYHSGEDSSDGEDSLDRLARGAYSIPSVPSIAELFHHFPVGAGSRGMAHAHGLRFMNSAAGAHAAFGRAAPRSYATNSNDQNAGRGAENPLEIADSDSDVVEIDDEDDDDDVEIVSPTPPRRHQTSNSHLFS